MNEVETRIQNWLDGPFPEEVKREIRELQRKNPQALHDAFFKDLSFGTGGMRGLMGIGTNRMNRYTIAAATQGLANYLSQKGRVFIGYDVRNHSREFAEEAAAVLAGNGIEVLLSKEICPTPLVSFACRYFHCNAAIMITASHNPPAYNGYKVYWSDGCQVVSPHDTGIVEEARRIHSPLDIRWKKEWREIGSELDEAYLQELKKLQLRPASSMRLLYSNLHGTGIRIMEKALRSWGYYDLDFVDRQKPLDGNFSHAPSPNPEEEKALALGTEQMLRENRDLFFATDPDADRMGAVVNHRGKAVRLTGNQIACLCLAHICKAQKLPPQSACIKTIVTTELFSSIARKAGIDCIDVLTGFKYIGEQIGKWEKKGPHFIFGAEESYGYLFGTFVRDKDAISASCLLVEAASELRQQGKTLIDQLHELYRIHGLHRESLTNLSFPETEAGTQEMQKMMKKWRENSPTQIGSERVLIVEDYLTQTKRELSTGKSTPLDLPRSDVLRFWLSDGSKLVIRPSGTEPKVKIYAEVVDPSPDLDVIACDERLRQLVNSFLERAKTEKN
jgi:phosphoglucomutase/phosphomannomutase